MGQVLELTAADGHGLQAYRADPTMPAKGGVVVVQEIFGVNAHVREVADGYAANGYVAIAPALFDRTERGVELGYDEAGIERGRNIAFPLGWDGPVADIAAAADAIREVGKIGVVGYCWGGSLAFVSACRLDIDAAVGYYGGQITKFMDEFPAERPKHPVMLHFGRHDAGIPLEGVERIGAAFEDVPIHLYDAGHGFNCDHRGSHDADATGIALERTLAFFGQQLTS